MVLAEKEWRQANRQLIPEVSCEAKGKAHMLSGPWRGLRFLGFG